MTIWYAPSPHSLVDLAAFTPDQVNFQEVARCLSGIRRFNGSVPFSVAQHSLAVASLVSDKARPWALLHDAHEAYTGDIPGPVKAMIRSMGPEIGRDFDLMFNKLDYAICEAAGIVNSWADPLVKEEVHEADKRILHAEMGLWFDRDVLARVGAGSYAPVDLRPFVYMNDPYVEFIMELKRWCPKI